MDQLAELCAETSSLCSANHPQKVRVGWAHSHLWPASEAYCIVPCRLPPQSLARIGTSLAFCLNLKPEHRSHQLTLL